LPPKLEGIVEVAACTHRHQGNRCCCLRQPWR
jgi:hypothetical protein